MRKFMEVVPPDTSLEQFQAVLGSGLVADIFHADAQIANRLAVRHALGLGALPSTPGSHVVDYSLDLEAMIAAGGSSERAAAAQRQGQVRPPQRLASRAVQAWEQRKVGLGIVASVFGIDDLNEVRALVKRSAAEAAAPH